MAFLFQRYWEKILGIIQVYCSYCSVVESVGDLLFLWDIAAWEKPPCTEYLLEKSLLVLNTLLRIFFVCPWTLTARTDVCRLSLRLSWPNYHLQTGKDCFAVNAPIPVFMIWWPFWWLGRSGKLFWPWYNWAWNDWANFSAVHLLLCGPSVEFMEIGNTQSSMQY